MRIDGINFPNFQIAKRAHSELYLVQSCRFSYQDCGCGFSVCPPCLGCFAGEHQITVLGELPRAEATKGIRLNVMENIVALAGHLAWPLTVLIIMFAARQQIREAILSISGRIRDPRSSIDITKEGLKITTIEAKLESLEIDQEQVKSLALRALNVPEKGEVITPSTDASIDPELQRLADDYLKIEIADWRERVQAKDAAARTMADLVITKSISRDLLTSQSHEGIILALAATIHSLPQQGDLGRLMRIADEVNRLHVRYRIVLAFVRLFERGIATRDDLARVSNVLTSFKRGADAPLLRRLELTERTIRQISQGS